MRKIFIILVLVFSGFQFITAQVGLITDCQYYFGLRPMIGSMNTTSTIAQGVNPSLNLQGKGTSYGIDLHNATWTYAEGQYLVSQIQVPIRFRYMNSGDNGFSLSDGTALPAIDGANFTYFDFGLSLIYSPVYLKLGPILFAPKIGIGVDMANHDYQIDLSKFIGKEGTNSDLQNQINAVAPAAPVYNISYWKDVYGLNIGTNVNLGSRIILDFNYDYYPSIFLDRDLQNTLKQDFGGNLTTRISIDKSILNRLSFEARFYVLTNLSFFVRYESSDYAVTTEDVVTTSGAILLNRNNFHQRDNNLLFGLDVVFLQ